MEIIKQHVTVDERILAKDLKAVAMINAFAGNVQATPETFESNMMRQTKIDLLECLELLAGVVTGDMSEIRDALADKRVTLCGFTGVLPVDLEDDFTKTVESLYSRFDSNIADAIKTHQKYEAMGVKTYISESIITGSELTRYANKVLEDCVSIKGETFSKGKFVKSVNYKDHQFTDTPDFELSEETAKERWMMIRQILTRFIEDTDTIVSEM